MNVGKPSADNRSPLLAEVRRSVDEVVTMAAQARLSFPLRYPVPIEVDELFTFEERLLAKVRDGRYRRMVGLQ